MTQISIDNAKNEITAIVYQNKIYLDGNQLPVRLFQKNIDEVGENITYLMITK